MKYNERTPAENWLDTQFLPYGTPEEPLTSMTFGPKFLADKLYRLSPPEVISTLLLYTLIQKLLIFFLEKINKYPSRL